MNNGIYLGGFADIAAGMQVTAQNVPAAQANMLLARFISFILYIVTVASTAALYIIPALFIFKGLMACTPLGSLAVRMGGRSSDDAYGGGRNREGGIFGFLKQNFFEFIVSVLFALNGAAGLIWTEMGWISSGSAIVVQKIANAGFSTADTPASMKQFKDDVKVYSDEDCASMYEQLLQKEVSQEQSLKTYVQSNSPDSTDMNFTRQKAAYTSTVARLSVLSDKLQNDNFAKASGISDPNFFKRHLQKSSATSNTEAPFNPAFIVPSTAQTFGVSLESSN